MLIDCDSCTARPRACGDCIVTHLLQVGPVRGSTEDSWADSWSGSWDDGGPDRPSWTPDPADAPHEHDRGPELTESEVAAVAVLSAGGLVPPLRLVTPARPATPPGAGSSTRAVRRGGRTRAG